MSHHSALSIRAVSTSISSMGTVGTKSSYGKLHSLQADQPHARITLRVSGLAPVTEQSRDLAPDTLLQEQPCFAETLILSPRR